MNELIIISVFSLVVVLVVMFFPIFTKSNKTPLNSNEKENKEASDSCNQADDTCKQVQIKKKQAQKKDDVYQSFSFVIWLNYILGWVGFVGGVILGIQLSEVLFIVAGLTSFIGFLSIGAIISVLCKIADGISALKRIDDLFNK